MAAAENVSPPFVGRRAEQARLLRAWEEAAESGEHRVVLVGGEPGVGKTRLATEVTRSLADAGVTVLYGRADDPSAPFQAWASALRPVGFVDVLRELSQGAADPSTARTLLFEAAVDALDAVSPAVVVLDDLQWADDSSLALARHFGRGPSSGALLLVLVYRDVDVDTRSALWGLVADLAGDKRCHRMSVVGLSAAEIGELTGREDAEHLRERSGGNPFLVTALVAYTGEGPPPAVADVVERRVQQLSDDGRRALTIAAVCGRQASPATVATVGGRPLLDGLDECVRAGLLGALDETSYEFVHDLVRECVLASLSPARRAQLHRDVAGALLEAGADEAEVDRHRVALGGTESLAAAMASADRARAVSAYETAARDGAIAFALAEDVSLRYELAMARAEDLALAGVVYGELASLLDAAHCARDLDDPHRMATAVARMPLVFAAPPVDDLIDETLGRLPAGDGADRARVLVRKFYEATNTKHPDEVAHILDEALAMAARVGDDATLARGVVVRSIFFADSVTDADLDRLGSHEQEMAVVYGTRTLRRGRAIRVTQRMALGDVDGARREVQQLADGGLRAAAQWTVAEWRAMEAFLRGRFDEARRLSAEAAAIGSALGEDLAEPNRLMLELHIAMERGDEIPDIGAETLLVGAMHAQQPVFELRVLAEAGDCEATRRLLDGADIEETARTLRWPMLLFTFAWAVALCGERAQAATLLDHLARFSGTVVMPPLYPNACLGAADRILGLLAERAGRAAATRTHLALALEVDVRIGADVWAAHDRYLLGRVLLADDPERATALLDAAASEAGRMGLRPLAARIAEAQKVALFRPDDGGSWLALYDGVAVRLPARRGFTWLASLLERPGEEIAALDLVGGGSWDRPPALDDIAKAQYRARLTEIDAEIEMATARNDLAGGDRARLERDALLDELTRAVGQFERDRPLSADSERARINVTRALRRAVDEVRRAHPALAAHLDATVRTGLFCAYTPDPRAVPAWRTR